MTLDEVKAAMQAAMNAVNSLDTTPAPVVHPDDTEVDIIRSDGSVQKFVIPTE